jgi:hypothetical protein
MNSDKEKTPPELLNLSVRYMVMLPLLKGFAGIGLRDFAAEISISTTRNAQDVVCLVGYEGYPVLRVAGTGSDG